MSQRPTITNTTGATCVLTVPPGWLISVSAVSRKPYNQLVSVVYQINDEVSAKYFANQWGQSNKDMLEIDSNDNNIAIVPQPSEVKMMFEAYYSIKQSIRGLNLESSVHKSTAANILTTAKGLNESAATPDYVLHTIMVEDAPGAPMYDDLVITINLHKSGTSTGTGNGNGSTTDPTNTNPAAAGYNLKNIQGDVLPALPKALERFYYFRITNLPVFKQVFRDFVLPKITTSDQLVYNPPPPFNPNNPDIVNNPFLGLGVGFSHLAMKMFGLADNLGDVPYEKGQQQDSKELGDAGTQRGSFWSPNWEGAFKEDIHGIFLVTAYNAPTADNFVAELESKFKYTANRSAIEKVTLVVGYPRPGAEGPNDHFGYRGGMSNPQVAGVTFKDKMRYPGSPLIPMGTIVMGYDGDEDKDKRPAWAKDGSFMVTRKLNNLVPEFDTFLLQHGPRLFPDLAPQAAANKLGARLFGRWKNGTSVEMSPDNDDPSIANDPNRINNFVFDQSKGQARCPFGSHMRKSNPRNDVTPVESAFRHFIRRHNMPYGQEVTAEERDGNGTIYERGLHVVCYQSSITRGFKFIQEGWYNDPNFPPNKPVQPGYDPIFGQTGREAEADHRFMSGANPTSEREIMSFPHKFIDPKGGEYFFAPSISTMRDLICA